MVSLLEEESPVQLPLEEEVPEQGHAPGGAETAICDQRLFRVEKQANIDIQF